MGQGKVSAGFLALAMAAVAMGAAGLSMTQRYVKRKAPRGKEFPEADWLRSMVKELVSVKSREGLVLRGEVLRPKRPDRYWAICVHGYRENREAVALFARHYLEQGFSVLLPDLRGHGESAGNYATMGARDSEDLIQWTRFIPGRDPDAEILIHGTSMGATSALIATGSRELPGQVRCVVSDSAYSSYVKMCRQVARRSHVPFFLVKPAFSLTTRLLAGFWPGEADPVQAVKKSNTPTLFIHGEADTLVAPGMMRSLYQACSAPKDLLLMEESGHVGAVLWDPHLYWNKVEDFLSQHWNDKEKEM